MPRNFDILTAPLSGFHLLDASAGTGKTYNLTGLFLRLILEKGLGADEILVVTYTRAATADLRTRIRERIADCLAALQGDTAADPLIADLAAAVPDRRKAEADLYEALVNFDEAAVYTIHGFCQRILQEHSLETGTAFDLKVEPDIAKILREVVLDFWRRTVNRSTPGLLAYAGDRLQPEKLIRLAAKMRSGLEVIPSVDQQRAEDLLDRGELADQEAGLYAVLSEARDLWRQEGEGIREILEASDGLYKDVAGKLDKYFNQLDLFFIDGSAYFQKLPEALEKFAFSSLTKKTKKKHEPPRHSFFNVCDRLLAVRRELERSYEFLVIALKSEVLDFTARELSLRKEKSGLVSYDDLLLLMARALEDEDAERLAALIRNQFKAALIDEFQDTDPLQYQIFSRIYQDSKSNLLYIIGDPKQAIYSFRGADVFSYLEAVRSADTRDNLGFNFRSEPGLIRAVNTLFSQRDFPFLFEEIPFSPASPAAVDDSDSSNPHNGEVRSKGEKEVLTFNGKSEPPLQLWLGSRPKGESGLVNKAEATQAVISALAYEVCSLLTGGRNGEIRIGDRPLQAGDIAVLVRRNKEAGQVLEGLKQSGVGGVIQAGDDLFKSREAEELELVLQAVADPFNETAVRSALTTDLLPGTVGTVAELESEEERLASWCQRFQEYYHLWQAQGFMAMFRFLLEREGVRSQTLLFFDGERRLTNILHLGESLDRYTREYHKGMASVLRYLSENRQSKEGDVPEERQMRLESDEDRVRIVTVHTSKGLQYPVVFCPFAWGGGGPSKQEEVLFHRDEDLRPCLDLGSDNWEGHKEIARRETLAEELRLLYVALTRAVNRCYLVWGPFNTAQKSALGWLLHGSSGPGGSSPSVPQIALKEMSDEDIFSDLESLKSQAGGEIEISPLPGEECFLTPRLDQETRLEEPVFRGNIPGDFRIASFSYMADQGRRSREEMTGEGYFLHNREEGAFFPGGTKTGNLFHDLLENLDFREISGGLLSEREREDSAIAVVEARLRDYGFAPEWREAAGEILSKTVNTLLDGRDLRLKDVDRGSRLSEMEFYFPLSKMSGGLLSEVLTRHGGVYKEMAGLGFPEIRGFMKGYIDLVFYWQGRYHILDWKTNYLGTETADYRGRQLTSVMTEERYILQYLVYTVALHQYLSLRLPGYSYQDHFGGVYYLFLRGLEPDFGGECGVYYDLPPEGLIDDLTAVFKQS